MKDRKILALIQAVMAAVFYAINMPASKVLLNHIEPTMMAAFLYLGAGIGIGMLFISTPKARKGERLNRKDFPYVFGMVVLDIIAPILLMIGLLHTNSSTASLLNNFEIVATSIIALFIFKETISKRLWVAISLVILSSCILSVDNASNFQLSWGSVLVLLAAFCWGFENNCTRKIASKDTYEIVAIKGIFSGLGSLIIALAIGERIPKIGLIILALLLGFVAYGLSIFFYIRAQEGLGAARTSAYYAIAPFVGAALSFMFLREPLSLQYGIALLVMLAGSALVVLDTLIIHHEHMHTHSFVHTHDGSTHTHIYTHSHVHNHLGSDILHSHVHGSEEKPNIEG